MNKHKNISSNINDGNSSTQHTAVTDIIPPTQRRGTKGNDAFGYLLKRFLHQRTNKHYKMKLRRCWWALIGLGRMRRSNRMALTKDEEIACHELYDQHSEQMRSKEGIFTILSEVGVAVTQDDVEAILQDLRYSDGPVVPFDTWTKILETLKKRWQDTTMADTVELFMALGGSNDCSGRIPVKVLQTAMDMFDLPLPAVETVEPVMESPETDSFFSFEMEKEETRKPKEQEIDYPQLLTLVADADNAIVQLARGQSMAEEIKRKRSRVQFGGVSFKTRASSSDNTPLGSRAGSFNLPFSASGKELAAHKVERSNRGKQLLAELEAKAVKMGPILRAKKQQHQQFYGTTVPTATSCSGGSRANHSRSRGSSRAQSRHTGRSSSPAASGAIGERQQMQKEAAERLSSTPPPNRNLTTAPSPIFKPADEFVSSKRPKSMYLQLRKQTNTHTSTNGVLDRLEPQKHLINPNTNKKMQLLPPEFRNWSSSRTFQPVVRALSPPVGLSLPSVRSLQMNAKNNAYISSLATDVLMHMSTMDQLKLQPQQQYSQYTYPVPQQLAQPNVNSRNVAAPSPDTIPSLY